MICRFGGKGIVVIEDEEEEEEEEDERNRRERACKRCRLNTHTDSSVRYTIPTTTQKESLCAFARRRTNLPVSIPRMFVWRVHHRASPDVG